MGEQRHASLWQGYAAYESHHGTLTAATEETVTFAEPVAAVLVSHEGANTSDIWFTLEGTTPTADGTGDTGNVMVRVQDGGERALDKRTQEVKLISSGAADFQVIGLR